MDVVFSVGVLFNGNHSGAGTEGSEDGGDSGLEGNRIRTGESFDSRIGEENVPRVEPKSIFVTLVRRSIHNFWGIEKFLGNI